MTDIFFADLVCETSYSIGSDGFILDGAILGHRSFAESVPVGRIFYYRIAGETSEWEVGQGRINGDGVLMRGAIVSSNDNALVNFSAGPKHVHLTVSAQWFDTQHNKELPSHDHSMQDVDGLDAALSDKQDAGDYAQFIHGHDIDAINGLNAALDSKQAAGNYQETGDFADRDHDHNIANISGLDNISFTANSISIGPNIHKSDYDILGGVSLDLTGVVTGGFGAQAAPTTGSWDDNVNARSGCGLNLMRPTLDGSPPQSNLLYSFGYEYLTKDGRGNMTQFAIPYFVGSGFYGLRFRFNQQWSPWRAILIEGPDGVKPSQDGVMNLGTSNRRFGTIFASSGSINTSDERDKNVIGDIPDAWLDAWSNVNWARYKFNGGNRWHLGLVAQRIHAAFANHGIDAFDIGLCCFDTWDDQYETALDNNGDQTHDVDPKLIQEAGERWGLRYDECFAMEAAWQRREMERLHAKLGILAERD